MFPGWIQIGLVVLLFVLLFGKGKISELMGDVAKGISSFRKGLSEEDQSEAASRIAEPKAGETETGEQDEKKPRD